MNGYSDLLYQAKNNNKRIENIDKIRREHTFYNGESQKDRAYFLNNKIETEANDSFSIRIISVMLVLVVVMFLKQTGVFDDSVAYESVMAEIHRQVTVDEIESFIKEDAVYPVMNWINGEK